MARDTDNSHTAKHALGALVNLTTERDMQAAVVRHGVHVIFQFARALQYPMCQAYASKVIENAKHHPANRTALYKCELHYRTRDWRGDHEGTSGAAASAKHAQHQAPGSLVFLVVTEAPHFASPYSGDEPTGALDNARPAVVNSESARRRDKYLKWMEEIGKPDSSLLLRQTQLHSPGPWQVHANAKCEANRGNHSSCACHAPARVRVRGEVADGEAVDPPSPDEDGETAATPGTDKSSGAASSASAAMLLTGRKKVEADNKMSHMLLQLTQMEAQDEFAEQKRDISTPQVHTQQPCRRGCSGSV